MTNDHDSLTFVGAQRIAQQLRDHWAKRGHAISVSIEQITRKNGEVFHCVRSDLLNGLPRP
jgi:hypothetical protein